MALLLFVIVYGFFYIDVSNYNPFMPHGFEGTLTAAGVVFFSYLGFDTVSALAAEVKNPQRDLPIGIIGSLAFTTVLYILVALVLTGMIDVSAKIYL